MKNTYRVLALVFALCLSLSACKSAPQSAPQEEDSSGAAVVNPVHEVTADEQVQMTGIALDAPAGAENVTWLVIDAQTDDAEPAPIAEVDFTLDGADYAYRAQFTSSVEPIDISGMYYDWTASIEAPVDYCTAAVSTYEGEESVACATWLDVVPGIAYSLTTTSHADAERLAAVANATFQSAQGDADGDAEINVSDIPDYEEVLNDIRDALSAGADTQRYEEMGISYLYAYPQDEENPIGYALRDLNDDGIPELLIGMGGEYGMLFDAFSLEDGKLLHLFSSGERDRYILTEDNLLHNEFSSSAFQSGDYYHYFDGSRLWLEEGLLFDSKADEEHPWSYRSKEDAAAENDVFTPVSDDEVAEVYARHPSANIEMTPLA